MQLPVNANSHGKSTMILAPCLFPCVTKICIKHNMVKTLVRPETTKSQWAVRGRWRLAAASPANPINCKTVD